MLVSLFSFRMRDQSYTQARSGLKHLMFQKFVIRYPKQIRITRETPTGCLEFVCVDPVLELGFLAIHHRPKPSKTKHQTPIDHLMNLATLPNEMLYVRYINFQQ